jgi:membrane protein implicated in regulation of membrane protease activity
MSIVFIVIAVFIILGAWALLARLSSSPETDDEVLAKLGFKESVTGSEFVGKKVKVLTVANGLVRVELNGATWMARPNPVDFLPSVGDFVVIDSVDGLTLIVRRET